MIKTQIVDDLFKVMARDMKIFKFGEEDDSSFRNRILYSGLGKWIMQLFSDRDFEDDETDQVSKSHVTISALDVISSFKKICPEANDYFLNDIETINEIEDIYLNVGYINSGPYAFKYPNKRRRINMGSRTLVIDLDTNVSKYCGLGLFSSVSNTDINLNDFFVIKLNAREYFKEITKKLKYDKLSLDHGKIEIYNIEHNRWDFYNEKLVDKYEYSIVKIDDGLDYKIIRKTDSGFYCAPLPAIYSHKSGEDNYFRREVWRVILGLCAYEGQPAIAKIKDYYDGGIKITLGGYVFPFNEYSIFKCIVWPHSNSLDINDFVAKKDMLEAITTILEHLSIKVVTEEKSDGA